jgi:hypothetical protein
MKIKIEMEIETETGKEFFVLCGESKAVGIAFEIIEREMNEFGFVSFGVMDDFDEFGVEIDCVDRSCEGEEEEREKKGRLKKERVNNKSRREKFLFCFFLEKTTLFYRLFREKRANFFRCEKNEILFILPPFP